MLETTTTRVSDVVFEAWLSSARFRDGYFRPGGVHLPDWLDSTGAEYWHPGGAVVTREELVSILGLGRVA